MRWISSNNLSKSVWYENNIKTIESAFIFHYDTNVIKTCAVEKSFYRDSANSGAKTFNI